jgi:hypothetical protein
MDSKIGHSGLSFEFEILGSIDLTDYRDFVPQPLEEAARNISL